MVPILSDLTYISFKERLTLKPRKKLARRYGNQMVRPRLRMISYDLLRQYHRSSIVLAVVTSYKTYRPAAEGTGKVIWLDNMKEIHQITSLLLLRIPLLGE